MRARPKHCNHLLVDSAINNAMHTKLVIVGYKSHITLQRNIVWQPRKVSKAPKKKP